MKVYTFFTDSHKSLLDIFLKNFPYSDNIELNIKWFPQECKDGNYMSDGWVSTMKRKVEYILQSLNETPEDEWFVHSDCDIILFEGWEDILNKHKNSVDMMIQNDYTNLCAGFFFCKSNVQTKLLWGRVWKDLHKFEHDQAAMNHFIKIMPELKIGILPDSYFTYGLLGKERWNGEDFIIPDISNLKMFHANWTAGVKNKIELTHKVLTDKSLL
jgi:hypothetical protein